MLLSANVTGFVSAITLLAPNLIVPTWIIIPPVKSVVPDKVKIPPPCFFSVPVPVMPPEYSVLLYWVVVKVPDPKST